PLAPASGERGELCVAAHDFDVLLAQLARFNDGAAQVAFALAGLVAEQVLLAGLAPFQLAAGGHAEGLLGALVGLHLWHVSIVSTRFHSCEQKKKGPRKVPRGPGMRWPRPSLGRRDYSENRRPVQGKTATSRLRRQHRRHASALHRRRPLDL